nr:response regulator [Phenylobacterium sp.]
MNADRVLLVDDDYLSNLALHEYLEAEGFPVESVYCGPTALAALRDHPPQALVTDVDLGPGPDGFDVARAARAACPQLTVVYISAHNGNRHPAEGVPGSEFVAKPFQGKDIVAALRRAGHLKAA